MHYNTNNGEQRQQSFFRPYKMSSERTVQVQGYESRALDYLINDLHVPENTIKVQTKLLVDDEHKSQFPVKYIYNGTEHLYFPDIMLIDPDRYIEVKSTHYFYKEFDKNVAKMEACHNLNLKLEMWIYSREKFEYNCQSVEDMHKYFNGTYEDAKIEQNEDEKKE